MLLSSFNAFGRAHDDIQEAQCLAAFLNLPGIIRYYKDKNRDILKLLEATQAPPQPYLFLLAAAQDLIRVGIAQHGVNRTHVRLQNQMVDMVDDLCDCRRLSAAMSGASAANAADVLPRARVGPVLEVMSVKDLEFMIRQLGTSASPGWTGWIRALIRRVAAHDGHSEDLLLQIHKFVTRSMKGELGAGAPSLLSTGRAVLKPKPDGGLRPLGIGEAWYRLIARCLYKTVVSEVSAALAPLQLGSGFSGGVEICSRLPLLALDGDVGGRVDALLFTLDVENAFNSMRRSHILKGIRK
jgi:hypothetical protein